MVATKLRDIDVKYIKLSAGNLTTLRRRCADHPFELKKKYQLQEQQRKYLKEKSNDRLNIFLNVSNFHLS